jgi:UDP-N-acetylmuramoyl-L-alanyl-D-glutamate--2,6-diaminopimelate ligase
MLQNTAAKKLTYSLRSVADFKGKIIENGLAGLAMTINDQEVHFRLIGEFNAYNLLAVYGAATLLGEDKQEVLQCLSNITGAEGRFDYTVSPKEKVIAIVDYAHTPDALLNVLATIKKLKQGNEQVITVVGCGGDRDKTKRPVMGEVACEHSDKVIFTQRQSAGRRSFADTGRYGRRVTCFGKAKIHCHSRPQAGYQNRYLSGAAGRYCIDSRKGT